MNVSTAELWFIIIALGVGSFAIRFVFLGVVGDRAMPAWVLRHLRYTAVAILPAMVAPLVMWPAQTGGEPDAARLLAALVTFGVGYRTRNVLWAMLAGGATLFGVLTLL